jgi:hypothetical protein
LIRITISGSISVAKLTDIPRLPGPAPLLERGFVFLGAILHQSARRKSARASVSVPWIGDSGKSDGDQAFEQARQPQDAFAVVMPADHPGLHSIACARMGACLDSEKRVIMELAAHSRNSRRLCENSRLG